MLSIYNPSPSSRPIDDKREQKWDVIFLSCGGQKKGYVPSIGLASPAHAKHTPPYLNIYYF
jgi:hypothetical protein